MKYRVPVEKVPGGEELLMISRSGTQKPMAVAGSNTITLDKWVGRPFPDFEVRIRQDGYGQKRIFSESLLC